MPAHRLTATAVKNAKPGKHEDGDGLRLVVSATGAHRWVLRYTLRGKRREMGLGAGLSLKKARTEAEKAREMAREGVDPISARQIEAEGVPSFTTAAARYIRAHRRGWKNAKHARQWVYTLKAFARPVIGPRPVDEVTTEDVLAILKPVWTGKTETAKRLQGRVENVLDYASAHGWRDQSNPARWRGHLDKLLPRPSRVAKVKHHPAMPHDEVAAYMAELSALASPSALALRFLILTATRTAEVLGATWSEIDLDAAVWTVPAERMKGKREHRVPLSPAALEVLAAAPRFADNPHVFPGQRTGRPLSTMALLMVMRRMGYGEVVGDVERRGDYVPHGFRSSFRDWAGEVSSFPRDVCEMALAHAIADKTEAAYRRGDLFDKRRKMMEQWAGYATASRGDVVQLTRKKGIA